VQNKHKAQVYKNMGINICLFISMYVGRRKE
jgi:hypothetical protein